MRVARAAVESPVDSTIKGVFDDASAERIAVDPARLADDGASRRAAADVLRLVSPTVTRDTVLLSQPRAPKIRNINGNPKVSLNLDGDTATGGGVLTIEGTAEVIGEIPGDRWLAYVAKYESRIRKGPWGTPDAFIAVFSSAIRIVPGRVRAW